MVHRRNGVDLCQKHILNARCIITRIAKNFIIPNFVPLSGRIKPALEKFESQGNRHKIKTSQMRHHVGCSNKSHKELAVSSIGG